MDAVPAFVVIDGVRFPLAADSRGVRIADDKRFPGLNALSYVAGHLIGMRSGAERTAELTERRTFIRPQALVASVVNDDNRNELGDGVANWTRLAGRLPDLQDAYLVSTLFLDDMLVMPRHTLIRLIEQVGALHDAVLAHELEPRTAEIGPDKLQAPGLLMPDDTKQHYFSCNLLWWSLRVSFGRSELLQAGDLAERVEEYDDRLDELGAWLMDQLVQVGRALRIGGQEGVALLNPPEIEQRVTHSVKALEELAASAGATDEARACCVYVAECSWVVAILRAFADFERGLSSDDVSARYRRIGDEIREVIAWIEAQRDQIAADQLSADTLGALRDRTAPVIDAATRMWPDQVHGYSASYPHPGSQAHRS
jgi:hypothetical protein